LPPLFIHTFYVKGKEQKDSKNEDIYWYILGLLPPWFYIKISALFLKVLSLHTVALGINFEGHIEIWQTYRQKHNLIVQLSEFSQAIHKYVNVHLSKHVIQKQVITSTPVKQIMETSLLGVLGHFRTLLMSIINLFYMRLLYCLFFPLNMLRCWGSPVVSVFNWPSLGSLAGLRQGLLVRYSDCSHAALANLSSKHD
jgi:hypothetical protein